MHKWLIFITASLVLILTNIDYSAVNLALASIATELHMHLATVQWIINGYSSAAAAFAVIGGRLGDIYGYRKMFIVGVAIFTITSIFIGFAQDKWEIIVFRIIQGAGAAICWPLCIVITSNAFPENQRGFAVGITMAVASVALVFGPIIGGILLHFLNWRWIFLINIPIGILTIILAALYIPLPQIKSQEQFHVLSAALIVLGLLSITTALNEGLRWGLASPLFHLLFWTGIVLVIIFVFLQSRIKNPLLNFKAWFSPSIGICLLLRITNQIVLLTLLFVFSLLLQNILGHTSLTSSFILFSLTAALSIAAFGSGKFIDRYGSRNLIFIGFILNCIAALWLTQSNISHSLIQFIIPLIIAGLGIGMLIPSLTTAILNSVTTENRGMISGLNYSSLYLGGSIGTVLVGWILYSQSSHNARELALEFPALNFNQQAHLQTVLNGVYSLKKFVSAFTNIDITKVTIDIQRAFFHAFSDVMWMCVWVSVFSFLLAWKIKRDI